MGIFNKKPKENQEKTLNEWELRDRENKEALSWGNEIFKNDLLDVEKIGIIPKLYKIKKEYDDITNEQLASLIPYIRKNIEVSKYCESNLNGAVIIDYNGLEKEAAFSVDKEIKKIETVNENPEITLKNLGINIEDAKSFGNAWANQDYQEL